MINADDMQSWAYLLAPTFQFVNTAGKPLTEGWLEVYIAGTRDKYYCASDFNGTLHPFQIPLDSLGANIVLADPSQAYDVYVYNKYGSLVMDRYHVSPSNGGGSGVLNITIGSEDGTVTVNSDGTGNFDLSIQDTVDRVEALELAVSGINAEASIGYAIAHADINNQDGTFNLIEDGVSGIDFTPNVDGFRLKSGHVYQFNFNAKFDLGENDRNCSGKFYLEGPDTIAQDWLFDLDDSYNHSESFSGATVLVTPKDLNFYDIKLKYQWDSAYSYPPDIDLNKISIVDVTSILSTTVSGIGGDYTGGDGIYINDETNVISVDMDYINSHLNIDATEIIASAVNIATAYTDARVTSASGDLVNLIAEVSASIPTAISQVQSDWTETNTSSPAYIQHKPTSVELVAGQNIGIFKDATTITIAASGIDPTNYVTEDELTDVYNTIVSSITYVSGTLDDKIDTASGNLVDMITEVSAAIPSGFTQVNSDWNAVSGAAEILNKPDLSIYATNEDLQIVSAAIPDVSDYATHSEVINTVSSVSSVLQTEIDAISGAIPTDYVTHNEVSAVSGNIINYVNSVSGDLVETINNVSGDIIETITTVSGDIIETVNNVSGDIINTVESVSGDLIDIIETATANIPEQVNADWDAVSGKAEILNKPDLSIYATNTDLQIVSAAIPDVSEFATHTEVSGVSSVLNERINTVSGAIITYQGATGVKVEDDTISLDEPLFIQAGNNVEFTMVGDVISINAVQPVVSGYATHSEVINTVSSVSSVLQSEIEAITGTIPSGCVTHDEVSAVSGNIINYVNSVSGDIVNYVDESVVSAVNVVTAMIPEQVNADWDAVSGKAEILNKPDLSVYATHSEVNTVSGTIVSMIPSVSSLATKAEVSTATGILQAEIDAISAVTGGTTYTAGDYIGIVDDTISVTGITDLVAGNAITITASGNSAIISSTGEAQVQSDWDVTDSTSKAYIKNKPTIHTYTGGEGIDITNDTVSLDNPLGLYAGDNVTIEVSGTSAIISAQVPSSGFEYGQFYSTAVSGAATMAKAKGNIDVTNDGKIILKQGQSYHVTVRGRYNQSTPSDDYGVASYIEYITNNSINISVDKSRTDSQFFELSYDLYKLNSDTNYYVFFTLNNAVINDLFIDIHSITDNGTGSGGGGSSPEYDAGYGIQILNNVISVSGIAPQIQSDWTQTNTNSVDYIKNKPEEAGLIAGDNISITASGNNFIISSTASAATGIDYQAGYGIDITGDTISVVSSIIPDAQINSDWTATSGKAEILNKPNESELIAGDGVSITASGSNYIISAAATGYVTESQLQSVSGILETEIQTVSAAIPTVTLQSLNTANVSDIQIVNAPSACTGANILYLIPEA